MHQSDSLRNLLDDLEARRLDRRSFLQRAGALGLSVKATGMLLAAAGSTIPFAHMASAQESGGTLTFAVSTDPETLDAHMTSNGSAWTVFNRIYSSLVYQDLDLTYKGLLAESWETSDDNLEITFTLREGITFHDGSPFNADAVKFTFERLQEIGTKNPIHELANRISEIEVIDEKTVKLIFSEPSATFFHAISGGYGGMFSPSAVEAAGDEYGRQPVGTNSFALKDWHTGSMVTLGSFADFAAAEGFYENQGAPHVDEVAYKVIPESFSQIASLEAGEIDAVALSATDLPRFENDDRFEIFSSNETGVMYLGLTSIRPLMSDLKVRQAIAHAVDRDEIIDTLYSGGLAEAAYTALPPSNPAFNEELADLAPHFDLEAAKSLLAEAGWAPGDGDILHKDGEPLKPVMYTTTSTTLGQLATLIQAQLRVIGIDVEVKQLEIASLLDFTPKGEHDMLLLSYGWGDPDALYLFLSTDRLQSSNRVHYSNPDFDALLKDGQRELDHEKRMQIYYEAQKILIEDQPWVPLFMPITKTAVAKRVQGVEVFPTGGLLLNDAHISN